ncbi:hypothetical protein HPB50_025036 [Hyalomma asiaticum]|uniref:Uncharacterized protein n=1 Tax=Hyalomma asiaticum TaxID=266040 RepID=A0ACB7TP13_HYAAI|nr:hypothetical protein HPB50_025036 [Hyalomma asiaticum]
MYLYNFTLQRATGITHAVHGNFSGTKLQEVAVSRGKILELLRPDPNTGKVYTLYACEVFGIIRSLMSFRLTGGSKDYLVVGSDSGRIVILEYNPQKGCFEKVHQETFGKSGCRRIVPGQHLAMDPKGRALMVAAVEKQKLVYILNRDAAARLTISSPLEAHKSSTLVYHCVGVDVGFENPVFACLEMDYEEADSDPTGETASNTHQTLTFYELDLGLNHVVRKYSEPLEEHGNFLIAVAQLTSSVCSAEHAPDAALRDAAFRRTCARSVAMDRSFKKKRKTELAYGKRKRRTPNPRRSRVRTPSRQSIAETDATLDLQSSRDAVNNTGEVRCRCVSSSEDDGVDATVHRREAAHSPNEEDRAVKIDSEAADGEMTDAPSDAAIVPGESHTIQGHIQPSFVSAETAEAQSTTVLESLSAMSATERKLALTTTLEHGTTPTPGEEEQYVMMQMGVLNAIIGITLYPPTVTSLLKPTLQPSLVKAQEMTKKIAAFIACGLQPYSVVEEPSFIKMMRYAIPEYVVLLWKTFA